MLGTRVSTAVYLIRLCARRRNSHWYVPAKNMPEASDTVTYNLVDNAPGSTPRNDTQ